MNYPAWLFITWVLGIELMSLCLLKHYTNGVSSLPWSVEGDEVGMVCLSKALPLR